MAGGRHRDQCSSWSTIAFIFVPLRFYSPIDDIFYYNENVWRWLAGNNYPSGMTGCCRFPACGQPGVRTGALPQAAPVRGGEGLDKTRPGSEDGPDMGYEPGTKKRSGAGSATTTSPHGPPSTRCGHPAQVDVSLPQGHPGQLHPQPTGWRKSHREIPVEPGEMFNLERTRCNLMNLRTPSWQRRCEVQDQECLRTWLRSASP